MEFWPFRIEIQDLKLEALSLRKLNQQTTGRKYPCFNLLPVIAQWHGKTFYSLPCPQGAF